MLVCLIAITCISICGRILNSLGHSEFASAYLSFATPLLKSFGPVVGDFELVEAGVAFAIMSFIPLCQLNRAHAVVEVATGMLPIFAKRLLAFVWEVLFAFVFIIIAWRLYVGTTDKMRYGETTFMLQFPTWWGYAACTVAAVVTCVVAVYSVWLHFDALRTSRYGDEVAS